MKLQAVWKWGWVWVQLPAELGRALRLAALTLCQQHSLGRAGTAEGHLLSLSPPGVFHLLFLLRYFLPLERVTRYL